jgi:hypothetical protein
VSFAERYKNHAYADLIEEAEKQGIAIGVKKAEARVIKLLRTSAGETCDGPVHVINGSCLCDLIALIKGENK